MKVYKIRKLFDPEWFIVEDELTFFEILKKIDKGVQLVVSIDEIDNEKEEGKP